MRKDAYYKNLLGNTTPKTTGKEDGDNKEKEQKDWKEIPKYNIPFSICLIVGATIIFSLEINYSFDCSVQKHVIYWLCLGAIAVYRTIQWYLGVPGWQILKKASVFFVIFAIFSSILTVGIVGYGKDHILTWKNELFQKNEVEKVERQKGLGLIAEFVRDNRVYSEKGNDFGIFGKGDKFPLVLEDGNAIEKQDGPEKLVLVYLPHKPLKGSSVANDPANVGKYIFSEKSEKAWVRLEDVITKGRPIQYRDFRIEKTLDGKVWTITFQTDELVKVIDNFKIGTRYILSGAPYGKVETPYVDDFSKFMPAPMGGVRENKTANSLWLKGSPGVQISIRFL